MNSANITPNIRGCKLSALQLALFESSVSRPSRYQQYSDSMDASAPSYCEWQPLLPVHGALHTLMFRGTEPATTKIHVLEWRTDAQWSINSHICCDFHWHYLQWKNNGKSRHVAFHFQSRVVCSVYTHARVWSVGRELCVHACMHVCSMFVCNPIQNKCFYFEQKQYNAFGLFAFYSIWI